MEVRVLYESVPPGKWQSRPAGAHQNGRRSKDVTTWRWIDSHCIPATSGGGEKCGFATRPCGFYLHNLKLHFLQIFKHRAGLYLARYFFVCCGCGSGGGGMTPFRPPPRSLPASACFSPIPPMAYPAALPSAFRLRKKLQPCRTRGFWGRRVFARPVPGQERAGRVGGRGWSGVVGRAPFPGPFLIGGMGALAPHVVVGGGSVGGGRGGGGHPYLGAQVCPWCVSVLQLQLGCQCVRGLDRRGACLQPPHSSSSPPQSTWHSSRGSSSKQAGC
jgi:hypothetical protein